MNYIKNKNIEYEKNVSQIDKTKKHFVDYIKIVNRMYK